MSIPLEEPQRPVKKKQVISASVREMVTFVLRTGDLGGSGHFGGANRALEGTRGHQRLQKKRPSGYKSEVVVNWSVEVDEFIFELKGRIDGVLAENGTLLVEEIKTTNHPWVGPADSLHLAQAKVYAFLYAQEHLFEECLIRVTYLHLESDDTLEFTESMQLEQLREFFNSVVAEYLQWLREHQQWCRLRDESIKELAFPFERYRAGQRALAVAAFRTAKSRSRLFAEAPTGIGKTASVLFPTIKAMHEGHVEKIFYLTAKTVGRTVAEKALETLRSKGLRLRSVTITAKSKICFNNGQPCDLTTCPFAVGYYDRIKRAVRDALNSEAFTRGKIEDVARKHQVCPFELSLDLSLWVDVIICDYNYVFDPSASLKRYFSDERHDYAILVDEAHNLVDRAREMFSAHLDKGELLGLKRVIESNIPRCAKALGKIASGMSALRKDEGFADKDGTLVSKSAPEKITRSLDRFLEEAELWLVQNESTSFRSSLLDVYFQVIGFKRILEVYDEHYVTLYTQETGRLRLFCVDPSALLRNAIERTGSAVFFSATLSPLSYYRDSLGGSESDSVLQLPSPFPRENLSLLVQDRISTRLRARSSSYDEVASVIGAMVEARKGNYIIFLPSYDYLSRVLERFRRLYSNTETLVQTTGMTEVQREEFISRFETGADQPLVAFAVLGGIFGEGIDLIGERLIGVAVVGVGLPQISLERELIREHSQGENRSGFDYAYTFPGMNRVLQAVGRVIRSETDRGVVLLIDERFRESRYQALFPVWWNPEAARNISEVQRKAKNFWITGRGRVFCFSIGSG